MAKRACMKELAQTANRRFELNMHQILLVWVRNNPGKTLLRFDRPLDVYLNEDALRDFFLNTDNPLQALLKKQAIASHLGRSAKHVYFDPTNGDPLFSKTEQRIYNFARRMEGEKMHIPFRSIHPNKQTEAGDIADISSYLAHAEEVRYNSGNHFSSRPANTNVFDENSKRCIAKSTSNLHIIYKRGFLEDRLHELKAFVNDMHLAGESQWQFFVICSRHSPKEGHFGVSVVIMNPLRPDFPERVMVCDTLLKDLPHHPRWWNHFVDEYSAVFGDAIAEIIEDLSHPLQKVNVKGDDPYRHDWDCPYYAASMANALADLVRNNSDLILTGTVHDIHSAMKTSMAEYYLPDGKIKERDSIQAANRLKRWRSGMEVIRAMVDDFKRKTPYQQ